MGRSDWRGKKFHLNFRYGLCYKQRAHFMATSTNVPFWLHSSTFSYLYQREKSNKDSNKYLYKKVLQNYWTNSKPKLQMNSLLQLHFIHETCICPLGQYFHKYQCCNFWPSGSLGLGATWRRRRGGGCLVKFIQDDVYWHVVASSCWWFGLFGESHGEKVNRYNCFGLLFLSLKQCTMR